MVEIKKLVKEEGPKLIPFFGCVILYFVHELINFQSVALSTALKCAPIVCLMFFILCYKSNNINEILSGYQYKHKILFGLLASCVGDALLNIGEFSLGIVAFGVAQCFYIAAFGLKKDRILLAIIIYTADLIVLIILLPNIHSIVIMIGLPIYSILLTTMCWRSIAQVVFPLTCSMLIKILCAIGSVLFVASDTLIAFDRFYAPISHRTFWIMATYYIAQLFITISIADAKLVRDTNPLRNLKRN